MPFCAHHCGYCNFTVVAGRIDLADALLSAIERELRDLEHSRPVDTLYIGGGTPTQLSTGQLDRLLTTVRHWYELSAGGELTVEANPADVDDAHVEVLARHGVTRVSLGAQSFQRRKLGVLERDHTAETIYEAIRRVRGIGAAVSLDLIFAVPNESLWEWEDDLQQAISAGPEHVSTYALTYERGMAFWGRLVRGDLAEIDEETQAGMYETAIDRLGAAGLSQYEISNFARSGCHSRHNETYWMGDAYFAVGPGAARYVDGVRSVNHRSTTTYIRRVLQGQSPVAESECLAADERARELLVLGLRRRAGVSLDDFFARTGMRVDALCGESIAELVRHGFVDRSEATIRLTRRGLLVADSVWSQLLRG
ncbi:MAG: radical SAM family heme chaperone HemW [Planctomycetales bacterium]|nr:radical SAM family heme chaperone HemW [Planctomycetales bacterium]